MFVTPLALIDQTIDHLETLTEVLADEVDARVRADPKPEARLCKETILTIGILLAKLKAVRCSPIALPTDHPRSCAHCDGD